MQSANYSSPLTVQGNTSGEALPVTTASGSVATVTGAAADGAAVSGNPVLIAGYDGSLAQTLLTDTSGRPITVPKVTSSAAADGVSNTFSIPTDPTGSILRPVVYPAVFNSVSATWDRERSGSFASGTFTPAASSHTNGDCNGAAATFAIGGPPSGVFEIISATLLLASGTNETTAWTLHLYNVTPPSALADDAAWDLPSGDRASYQGSIALAQLVDVGSTCYIESNSIFKRVALGATGNLFGYLVNGTTLTPQNVAHTVTILGRFL